jgi:F0F1-type ATP synthase membrane subunit c/vacuolar-type H+-ATPase subunit K
MARTYKRKANGQFAGGGGGSSKSTRASRQPGVKQRAALGVLAQPKRQANAPAPSNFQRAAFGVFAGRGRLSSRGRGIIKKAAITATGAGVTLGAASFANAVVKGNRIADATNAASRARGSGKLSTATGLTTARAGRHQLPTASKPRRGTYKITKL